MTVSGAELVDVNLWLALVFGDHQYHETALLWFERQEHKKFAFCRITQMGLLRHLTNQSIMGKFVLGQKAAWRVYDRLCQE